MWWARGALWQLLFGCVSADGGLFACGGFDKKATVYETLGWGVVKELAPRAMAPFGAQPIYVANEAYGALRGADGVLGEHHGWAECSLVMAENVLLDKFGVSPPTWMNASVYDEYVRFHDEPAERARRGGWNQG